MFTDEPETFTLFRSYPVNDPTGTGLIDIGEIIGFDYEIADAFDVAKQMVATEHTNHPDRELIDTENGYVLLINSRVFVRYEITETIGFPDTGLDFL